MTAVAALVLRMAEEVPLLVVLIGVQPAGLLLVIQTVLLRSGLLLAPVELGLLARLRLRRLIRRGSLAGLRRLTRLRRLTGLGSLARLLRLLRRLGGLTGLRLRRLAGLRCRLRGLPRVRLRSLSGLGLLPRLGLRLVGLRRSRSRFRLVLRCLTGLRLLSLPELTLRCGLGPMVRGTAVLRVGVRGRAGIARVR